MAGNAGNGWNRLKWLEMVGHRWKWLEIAQLAKNDLEWLQMSGKGWECLGWLELAYSPLNNKS